MAKKYLDESGLKRALQKIKPYMGEGGGSGGRIELVGTEADPIVLDNFTEPESYVISGVIEGLPQEVQGIIDELGADVFIQFDVLCELSFEMEGMIWVAYTQSLQLLTPSFDSPATYSNIIVTIDGNIMQKSDWLSGDAIWGYSGLGYAIKNGSEGKAETGEYAVDLSASWDDAANTYGASGDYSTAMGSLTEASGDYSTAMGYRTTASGDFATAMGDSTEAIGHSATAMGNNTTASANSATAMGHYTTASGDFATAMGSWTEASGNHSTAMGGWTEASGYATTSMGSNTMASGDYSTAMGNNTEANVIAATAMGSHNKPLNGSAEFLDLTADAFVLGNGNYGSPSNAFRVTFDGKTYGLSSFNSTGADYAEYFEWLDGNPENEDRVGYFVTLDGEKIRKATSEDSYILGVISANPSVIGDSHQDDWHEKYVKDKWGRIQYHYIDVPAEFDKGGKEIRPARQDYVAKLNPDWDSKSEYIPREKRKEWSAVGIVGKLLVRDDGTCEVNGFCKPSNGGIATISDTGYRVIKRIDEETVMIFIKGGE